MVHNRVGRDPSPRTLAHRAVSAAVKAASDGCCVLFCKQTPHTVVVLRPGRNQCETRHNSGTQTLANHNKPQTNHEQTQVRHAHTTQHRTITTPVRRKSRGDRHLPPFAALTCAALRITFDVATSLVAICPAHASSSVSMRGTILNASCPAKLAFGLHHVRNYGHGEQPRCDGLQNHPCLILGKHEWVFHMCRFFFYLMYCMCVSVTQLFLVIFLGHTVWSTPNTAAVDTRFNTTDRVFFFSKCRWHPRTKHGPRDAWASHT